MLLTQCVSTLVVSRELHLKSQGPPAPHVLSGFPSLAGGDGAHELEPPPEVRVTKVVVQPRVGDAARAAIAIGNGKYDMPLTWRKQER